MSKPTSIRHAWLQKHPSPVADGGEFHWHPAEGDRELRGSCVERLRGVEPPAVLWELAPGRVAWAQPFAATAPHDKRRYSGLVLTISEQAGASAASLLEQVVVPPAAPWSAEPSPPVRASSLEDANRRSREAAGVARALLAGGVARVGDPGDPTLPAWVASLERTLPPSLTTRTRRGTFSASAAAPAQPDRVAELIVAAWSDPGRAAAWQLVIELAAARERSVDEIVAEVTVIDAVGALTDEERRALPGTHDFVAVLHAWGRGRFDQCPTAGTLTARLADAVALRVLARLVEGSDAGAAVAEARWYALLPAARRTTLLDAVAGRADSLRSLVTGGLDA